MTDYTAPEGSSGFRITGWHVLAGMILFFSTIIAVTRFATTKYKAEK